MVSQSQKALRMEVSTFMFDRKKCESALAGLQEARKHRSEARSILERADSPDDSE